MGFVEKGCVYWIHTKNHTNIKTDGYVGITKNPSKRFREHKSTNHRCFVIHNAIKKYGDELIYDIIWQGSYSGAIALEEYFRPHPQIGWNIRAGGSLQTFGESTKKKMSEAALIRGVSESTRRQHKLKRKKQVWHSSPNCKPVNVYNKHGETIAENVLLNVWCQENMQNPISAAQYLGYTARGKQKLYNNMYYATYINQEV